MFSLSLYRSLQILNGAVTSDRSPVWSYNIPLGWRLKTRKHSSPRRKPIYLECSSFHSQRSLMRTNEYLRETNTLMTGTNRYTKLLTSTTQNSDLYYILLCLTHWRLGILQFLGCRGPRWSVNMWRSPRSFPPNVGFKTKLTTVFWFQASSDGKHTQYTSSRF